MRAIRYFLMMVPVSIVSLATPEARAAKCALCEPNRDIYSLFPEATSYRTVDGRVDEDTRKSIEGSLGRKLAFSDLGKTSMCVVFKDKAPLGFVHARSEIGRYGAIQLVWAIDLDLRVKELWIQRSREKNTARLRRAGFLSPDGRIREALVRCKVSKEVRESLASLRGLRLKNLRDKLKSSKVVRYAAEVLAVLSAHDVVSRD